MSGRGKTPTFCVFPVFSVAVMEKCCDACGDGEYYLAVGLFGVRGFLCFSGIVCCSPEVDGTFGG
jgi:hypothetical protein